VLAAAIDRKTRALLRAENVASHAEFASNQPLGLFYVFV